jgi:hypothetical protein
MTAQAAAVERQCVAEEQRRVDDKNTQAAAAAEVAKAAGQVKAKG